MSQNVLESCVAGIEAQKSYVETLCRKIRDVFGDQDRYGNPKVHDYANDVVNELYNIPQYVVRNSVDGSSRFLSEVEVTVRVEWSAKRLRISAFFAFFAVLDSIDATTSLVSVVDPMNRNVLVYLSYQNEDAVQNGRKLVLDTFRNSSSEYTSLMTPSERLTWRKIATSELCCAVRFVKHFEETLYRCLVPQNLLHPSALLFESVPFVLSASSLIVNFDTPEAKRESEKFITKLAVAFGIHPTALMPYIVGKVPLTPIALAVANQVAAKEWQSWYPLQSNFVEFLSPTTRTTFEKVIQEFVQTSLTHGLVASVYGPVSFVVVDARNPGNVQMATTVGRFLSICMYNHDFLDPRKEAVQASQIWEQSSAIQGSARVLSRTSMYESSNIIEENNFTRNNKKPVFKITTIRVYQMR